MAEAILMGTDAASGWVLDELEDGKPAPEASPLENIIPEAGGFVSILVLDMDAYAEKYGEKVVRKNLTIYAWLNTFAEKTILIFPRCFRIPRLPSISKNSTFKWLPRFHMKSG